jgi:Glycosyl transferase family 2
VSGSVIREVIPGLVSTIIPVFNRPVLLREAVESVIAQTYRPIEIIVVDDGSTDETASVCRAMGAEHSRLLRVVRKENGGPGRARETGRELAKGEFIQYLDSDDRLLPLKFEKQVAALRARPDADVAYCYTRYLRIGETPEQKPWKRSGITVETMFPSFLEERWWDTPTPLYRRSVCDEIGPWSELSIEEDWEYDCRVAATGTRLVHCTEFLVEVRDHGGGRLCRGTSLDKRRMRQRAVAHRLILGHAQRAGLGEGSPSMQRFARELFLLARQCGAAGLPNEARELFILAKVASGPRRAGGLDYRIYALVAGIFGWSLPGKISSWGDRWRGQPERPAEAIS